MKRVLLAIAVALLLPGIVSAEPTMGLYFDTIPYAMHAYPPAYTGDPATTSFRAWLYMHHADAYVTAVEYALICPEDPYYGSTHPPGPPLNLIIINYYYPDAMSITNGTAFAGHSIAFWPPLNGYMPGYNVLCWYDMGIPGCWNGEPSGPLADYGIVVGPSPESGAIQYTDYPDYYKYPAIGPRSTLCPEVDAVEDASWGAIKSLVK
jgi:hypothetical protein